MKTCNENLTKQIDTLNADNKELSGQVRNLTSQLEQAQTDRDHLKVKLLST